MLFYSMYKFLTIMCNKYRRNETIRVTIGDKYLPLLQKEN